MPGFVPVNYKVAGKIMLFLSVLIFIAKIIELFIGTSYISALILFIAAAFLVIGAYLVFMVPKED